MFSKIEKDIAICTITIYTQIVSYENVAGNVFKVKQPTVEDGLGNVLLSQIRIYMEDVL